MQQLALRKAQDFILRAGNSGRGHAWTEDRSIRRAALHWGSFSLPQTMFLVNVIVKYCKTYLVLIFWDRSIILESQASFSRMRTNEDQ